MKQSLLIMLLIMCFLSCLKSDDFTEGTTGVQVVNCGDFVFPSWQGSEYVLPYPVGESYQIGLSACTSSYHGPGQPDQFAIDFNMPIGDEITASLNGEVVYVEESGGDFGFPNNIVVVKRANTYVQYMHLTRDGAVVEVGDEVTKGDLIGYSGATGLAGYPHLHFVVTRGDTWEYPYDSVPVTFSNTDPNPDSLQSGETYEANPY